MATRPFSSAVVEQVGEDAVERGAVGPHQEIGGRLQCDRDLMVRGQRARLRHYLLGRLAHRHVLPLNGPGTALQRGQLQEVAHQCAQALTL